MADTGGSAMGENSARARLGASVAWVILAGAAGAALLAGEPGWAIPPIAVGALLAFAIAEKDTAGWTGFLAGTLVRIGDTALVAAFAWLFAGTGTISGVAAASAALALALLAPYLRTRALSLGLSETGIVARRSVERGFWLVLVGLAVWTSVFSVAAAAAMLWGAAAFSGAYAAVRFVRIWAGASRA